MTQILLPIFPKHTELITPTLGVFQKSGIVYYLHSGMPIYSHDRENLLQFRFITSNLIHQGLCRQIDIVSTFHVSGDSVRRSLRNFEQHGANGFFSTDARHGHSYKMTPERLVRIQRCMDKGQSNYSIAKKEGISEGTIRYAIQQGKLKKSP